MDNFILYEEICKSDNSVIYKGRRKGSINFVAIHCIEKILRPEITNLVRLTYEIGHKNVVKFYEWYETSNHLWLVVELCSAGSLELLLEQDGCLPESTIRQFGVDICEGLFYCHSLGILFNDLIPRKILIDSTGKLKLSDFGYAKLESENLEQIFQETYETTSPQWSQSASKPEFKVYQKPFGQMSYMAPEIILGEDNTKESDLWSLGCILYKMYTGNVPFVANDVEQLKNMIVNKELPNPKGNKLSTKPSAEFLNLIKGLLEKNPSKRFNWKQTLNHPFWEKKLSHLLPQKSIIVDGKEKIVDNLDMNELNKNDDKVNLSHLLSDRPRTAAASTILEQKHPEVNVSFSISSRLPVSPQSTLQTRNALQCKDLDEQSSSVSTLTSQSNDKFLSQDEYRRLFFLPSELNVSQIVDNPRIQKPSSLKYEPKVLPFSNQKMFKAETFLQMSNDDLERHIDKIKSNTNVPLDKSAGAVKLKLHLLNYIGSICIESGRLSELFLNAELYKDLLLIVKNGHSLEMKMKAARILALLFNKAKKIDPSKDLNELLQGLVEIISANRKDYKFKQTLLTALGEVLFLISCQEALLGKSMETWSIPPMVYVVLIRSIGEDLVVNHIVCKIVQNIASTNSLIAKKFLNNQSEIVNALWSCYVQSGNNEQLRIDALNAICMLSSHAVSVFVTLIDKIGADQILEFLSNSNFHIQHIVLTMISMLVNDSNLKSIPEKKLISKLLNLYESTNAVCRAKSYLLTYLLIKQQNDILLTFSQSKLFNSLERDGRKKLTSKEENDYMHRVIDMLIELILSLALTFLDESIGTLESLVGRKNPSTTQTKQLKRCIPNTTVLKFLCNCQTFRAKLIDNKFIEKFGKLISLSKPINNGELNLDSICGTNVMSDYIDSIVIVLENMMQHKEIIQNSAESIKLFILPSIFENIDSKNSDLRVQSMKVLSELSHLFLTQKLEIANLPAIRKDFKSFIETQFVEIVGDLLVQPEPLPFFSLSILQSALTFDITLISILKFKNILPVFFNLLQTYKVKIGSTFVLKLLNIFEHWSSTVDPSDLYDHNIIDYLRSMILDISRIKRIDDKTISETLIKLLKILDNLLKYVSEFVKKALQVKKVAGSSDGIAQKAEKLLHSNRPIVSCCSYLIHLLINDDSDLNELSCKILWIIMQLFGSECKDLLNQENINVFAVSIQNSNSKKQKILLRIFKRIVTTDKHNIDILRLHGNNFLDSLKMLKNNANAEANAGLSSLVDDIFKLL